MSLAADKKQPWMKFYPADWRADPALRVCSIGARGLWIEMLCIMHDAEPRGSLLVGGRAVTTAQLAGLVGATVRLVQGLFDELENAHVFSRDGDGVIYSRRIRRDIERAERDKANGRTGGNPKLKAGDKATDKAGVNPPVKAQKPEARDQNSSLREHARDAFERKFWPGYPNKVGKADALKSFEKLFVEMGGSVERIFDGLGRYIREKPVDRAWLNPATFLNQRRFEDEPATPPARAGPNGGPRQPTMAEMARMDEPGYSFDDQRSDPCHSASETARDPDQGAGGFAGRLPVEDHPRFGRGKLVDH